MKKNNSVALLLKEECTGCRLCGDGCARKAITFLDDSEGFFYPQIDEDTCVECGWCLKVCPAMNVDKHKSSQHSYAVYATENKTRESGSSGGIFGLLAEVVLSEGGLVWGAAFDGELKLVHRKADNLLGLQPLLKSKYIQSDLTGVYVQIKKDIRKGIKTLFCGSPCQVNALRNYIGKDINHLITVDFVCHGVPNQRLFDMSIRWYEEKHNVKVDWFQFRYKGKGVKHPQSFALRHKGEKEVRVGLHYQFPYYFGFQKYMTLRPSCYQCKWACTERAGDITLGDYWGIEKFVPQLNAKDGVSMILCNTKEGLDLLNALEKENKVVTHTLSIERAVECNGCLQGPSQVKPERKVFFQHLQEWNYNRVVEEHLVPKKKWIFDLYYGIPKPIRNLVRKVMDKKMKYE